MFFRQTLDHYLLKDKNEMIHKKIRINIFYKFVWKKTQ